MMDREKAKHIDAFKYWCETNEENGVITIPKFLCEHIVEILGDTNARTHGEWVEKSKFDRLCKNCGQQHIGDKRFANFCPNCGADMRKEGEAE